MWANLEPDGGRALPLTDESLAEYCRVGARPILVNAAQMLYLAPHAVVAQAALLLVLERLRRNILEHPCLQVGTSVPREDQNFVRGIHF